MDWVAGILWIEWQASHGLSGNLPMDWVADIRGICILDALRWLGAPDTGVPLEALFVNPARPNRVEPRVKKRRPKAFPFMTRPRRTLRQALMQQTLGD